MMYEGSWCRIHAVNLRRVLPCHKQILQQLESFPFCENLSDPSG